MKRIAVTLCALYVVIIIPINLIFDRSHRQTNVVTTHTLLQIRPKSIHRWKTNGTKNVAKKHVPEVEERNRVTVAGLDCTKYGGPVDPSEMVYWRDIPQDEQFVSPFVSKEDDEEKYVTFEPDEGGFNNIRMALETVVTLSIAMGRTLVLPPAQAMYLLDDGNSSTQKKRFGFTDFYPLHAIARENKALKLMDMEEFLQKQGVLVNRNNSSGKPLIPPQNRTDWNGASKDEIWELHKWLRSIGATPDWRWSTGLVGFGVADMNISELKSQFPSPSSKGASHSKAVPVYDNAALRLSEVLDDRTVLYMYNRSWQNVDVIHFTGDIASGTRLLIHFYAFLFFDDWTVDLWMKRFVRDHLRYVDEIQCAAARIVAELRRLSPTNDFDTLHIRRGDFKVKKVRIDSHELYSNIEDVMTPNSTIYIATDEKDRQYFEPFFQRHQVFFLSDFQHLVAGLNTNYYGMVEQLVVARGRRFVGCMFSTFTAFVHRLRGYYSTRDHCPGYKEGVLPTSYHYAPIYAKRAMRRYTTLSGRFHLREFPIGWRDIDWDLENNVPATAGKI